VHHFRKDGEEPVAAVLRDLISSGLVYVTGSGPNTAYRSTSEHEIKKLLSAAAADGLSAIAWVTIYRNPGIGLDELALQMNVTPEVLREAVRALRADGRLEIADESTLTGLRVRSLTVPVGSSLGWEAAILDHFQAMATAIGSKLARQRQSRGEDV